MEEKTPEEIAIERIREAESLRSTRLDLSDLGIEKIPNEIIKLSQITFLNLNLNKITDLPDELFELVNLEELLIGGGKINDDERRRDIERESEDVTKYYDKLERFWKQEEFLSHTTRVDPKGNKLNILNPKIAKLQKLKYLDVSSNNLKSLPDEVCDLVNLKVIDFGHNDNKNFQSGYQI
jgi:internalin A